MDGVGGSRRSGRQGHAGAIIDGPCCHSGAHSTTRSMMRRRRGRVGPSSWPLLSLLLAALLALQPCGAPPINPGQNEELKLPIVRDTVKVSRGLWSVLCCRPRSQAGWIDRGRPTVCARRHRGGFSDLSHNRPTTTYTFDPTPAESWIERQQGLSGIGALPPGGPRWEWCGGHGLGRIRVGEMHVG